jgi:hypothetical protein
VKRVRIEIFRYTRIVSTDDRSVIPPELDVAKLLQDARGARQITRSVGRLLGRWRRKPKP